MPVSSQPLSAFAGLLGLVVDRAAPGVAVLSCAWRPELENTSGIAHGGLVAALMDTACGVAMTTNADGGRRTRVVTVSFALSYLAPFRDGTMRCEARVTGGGGRLGTVEARTFAVADGMMLAVGHGVFRRIGAP